MTKSEMSDIVDQQLSAYNRRDLESFWSNYHHEIEVAFLWSGKPPLVGIDNIRKLYKKLFEENLRLHCTLKSRIATDVAVIDEELVQGLSSKELHTVAIYGFKDGLIHRVWFSH